MSDSLLLTSNLARLYRQTRGNPVVNLVPLSLTRAINNFELGWLRDLALIYERLENGADLDIAAVGPKRRAAVSGLEWDIIIDDLADDEAEAQRHKQALAYCFNHLTVRNAVEPDEEGEVASLVENVMLAKFLRYSVHEILWQPQGKDLTAQLVYAPVSLFENTSGPLMYCGPSGGAGLFELDRDGWLVCKGRTLGMGLAIAWMFDSLSLGDWLEYNRNFALPGIHGETPHAQESKEFAAFVAAIDEMVARFRVVTGAGNKVNVIESSSTGGAAHEPLHSVMQRAKIVLCMDQDLSTLSQKGDSSGASVQQGADYLRIKADARFVEDAINRRFVRRVIEQCFGPGVQPRAWFRLLLPERQDDQAKISKYEFLIKSGVPVGRDQLAEAFGHSLPKPGAPLAQTQDGKTQDTRPEAQESSNPKSAIPNPQLEELSNAANWNALLHPRAPAGGEGSGGGRFVPKQGPASSKGPAAPAHVEKPAALPPAGHGPAHPISPPHADAPTMVVPKPALPGPQAGHHAAEGHASSSLLPAAVHSPHEPTPKPPYPPTGADMKKSLAPPPPSRIHSTTAPLASHGTGRVESLDRRRIESLDFRGKRGDGRVAFPAAIRKLGGGDTGAHPPSHGRHSGEADAGRDARYPVPGRFVAEGLKLREFPKAPPDLPSKIDREGGEHYITFAKGRAFKRTKRNRYGFVVTEDVEPGHQGPLHRLQLRLATPLEYFQRHVIMRQAFDVPGHLHGVELKGGTWPLIVTSQPEFPGKHPPEGKEGEKMIAQYMQEKGFEPQFHAEELLHPALHGSSWYNHEKQILVTDARRENFHLHEGKLTPLDLIVSHYPLTPRVRKADNEHEDAASACLAASALAAHLAL